MNYNTFDAQIYREVLQIDGEFNIQTVMVKTFLHSPDTLTKGEIKQLACDILTETLDNGLVKIVDADKGIYESIFSIENQKQEENKTHASQGKKDDKSKSRDL